MLSFTARISQLLLDVVGLLGAVNRRFVPTDEPKWMGWHLTRLGHGPADLVQRIEVALRSPSPTAMADLDVLVRQTLDLVDEHVPGADTRTARFATDLRPRPTR